MPFQVIFSSSQFNFFPVALDAVDDQTLLCRRRYTFVSNVANGAVVDAADVNSGLDIGVFQQGSGSKPEITTIRVTADGDYIPDGSYFTISSPTTDYYVWFNVDSSGSDPAPGGLTPIQVDIGSSATSLDSLDDIGSKIATAIDAQADFTGLFASDAILVIADLSGPDTTGHTWEFELDSGAPINFIAGENGTLSGETEIFCIFDRLSDNSDRDLTLYLDRYTGDEQSDEFTIFGRIIDPITCGFGSPGISSSPIRASVEAVRLNTDLCGKIGCDNITVSAPFFTTPSPGFGVCPDSIANYYISWSPPSCQGEFIIGWFVEENTTGTWVNVTGTLSPDLRWWFGAVPNRSYRVGLIFDIGVDKRDLINGNKDEYQFTIYTCSKYANSANPRVGLSGPIATEQDNSEFSPNSDGAVLITGYANEILSLGGCAAGPDDYEDMTAFSLNKEEALTATSATQLLSKGTCDAGPDDYEDMTAFSLNKEEALFIPSYTVTVLTRDDL